MRTQRLMRTWYGTDYEPGEDGGIGTFSAEFPAEREGHKIVNIDWSKPGEVEVTWLISAS